MPPAVPSNRHILSLPVIEIFQPLVERLILAEDKTNKPQGNQIISP
nr:MAG TPA: hypothetical protein [Caudoviricetes sp.]